MTHLQKEIYRSILSKFGRSYLGWMINFASGQNLDILKHLTQVSAIKATRTGLSRTNMNNMLMQLRKYVLVRVAIDHPYKLCQVHPTPVFDLG